MGSRPDFHPAPRESWDALVVGGPIIARGPNGGPSAASAVPVEAPADPRFEELQTAIVMLSEEIRRLGNEVVGLREWLEVQIRALHEQTTVVAQRVMATRPARSGSKALSGERAQASTGS